MSAATQLPLRLRPEVRVVRSGPRAFALVDQPNALYLGLDLEAYRVLRLLESCASFDEVLAGYRSAYDATLEPENVEAQFHRLEELGLLQTAAALAPAELRPVLEPPSAGPADAKANLNTAFDLLVVLFGWLLHPVWLGGVLVLAIAGGASLWQQWPAWLEQQYTTWQRTPFLIVLLTTYLQTLLLFNLPNALMMGMACRKYGGRLEGFGMQLWQGVVPVFHLDVGDSIPVLSERGRWTLVTTAIATPLALGSLYCLLWSASQGEGKAAAFWALSLPVASVILLLQCNPGAKTSAAYWALCLTYEDAHILERARAECRAWLGGAPSVEPLSRSDRRWLRFAGCLSYLWSGALTIAIWAALAWWFTSRLQGPGAVAVVVMFLLYIRSRRAGSSGLLSMTATRVSSAG